VLFQINTASLSANQGDLAFDVTVCNNQTGSFTHTFNYAATTGGFAPIINSTQSPDTEGVWTPGSGWESTTSTVISSGFTTSGIDIHLHLSTPVTLNTAQLSYNLTKGSITPGLTNGLYLALAGANVATATHASDTDPDGTAKTLTVAPGSYSVDDIEFVLHDSFFSGGGSTGASLIYQLVVTGQGADPF